MVRKGRPRRRARATWWWIGGGAAILVAFLAWMAVRPAPGPREAGIPITTLVGAEAPVLEFPDAAGRRYRVPERGRNTVLIFHMGLH